MSKKKINITYIILFILLAIPYIANIMQAIPVADDFSMLAKYDANRGPFLEALRIANRMWLKWSGEWFYSFIQVIANPMVYFDFSTRMFGVILTILFILFIISIVICTGDIIRYIFCCESIPVIRLVQFCITVIILGTDVYSEIYCWFVGSSYELEVLFAMICISLIIRYHESDNLKTAVILSLLGFFTCNAIMVVSFICLFYIAMFLPDIVSHRKKINTCIPFLFCLSGGLLGVAAPGNYTRHAVLDDSGLHAGLAIKNTLHTYIYLYANLRKLTVVIALIILFAISFYYANKHMKDKKIINPAIIIGFSFIATFLVIFPVTLGYSSANMPNRMEFMINTFMVFCLSFIVIDIGMWLGIKSTIAGKRLTAAIIIYTLLAAAYIGTLNRNLFIKIPYIQQITGYSDSAACRSDWICIYKEIDSSPDKDVIVKRNQVAHSDIIKAPTLSNDPNYCENYYTQVFFNKSSVRLIISSK